MTETLFLLAASTALFVWSMTGAVWDPLALILVNAQKTAGVLASLLFLSLLFSSKLRARVEDGVDAISAYVDRHKRAVRVMTLLSLANTLSFLLVYKHNSLQSHMHDFAIFLNVAWNVATGHGFYDPIINVKSFLGDHWSPVIALFSPVLRIWPEERIFLVAQGYAMALTAWGVYRIGVLYLPRRRWAVLMTLMFLGHPYFHKIYRFDFHPETLSMPLLVWGAVWFLSDRPWHGLLLLSLTWFIKEDLPITTAGIALVLLLKNIHRRQAAVLLVLSAAAFALVVGVLMPHFLGSEGPTHLARYSNLGHSPKEIIATVLLKPHVVAWDVLSDDRAWITAFLILVPFFGLPLLSVWGIAALAAWGPHLISHSWAGGQRILTGPYSTGVLTFLAVAAAEGLALLMVSDRLFRKHEREINAWGFLLAASLVIAHWAFGVPKYTQPTTRARIEAFDRVRRLIPSEASVCAQGDLGTHVAFRHVLTQFPLLLDTSQFGSMNEPDYIFLEPGGNTWILDDRPFEFHWNQLKASETYELVREDGGFYLYKRKGSV